MKLIFATDEIQAGDYVKFTQYRENKNNQFTGLVTEKCTGGVKIIVGVSNNTEHVAGKEDYVSQMDCLEAEKIPEILYKTPIDDEAQKVNI